MEEVKNGDFVFVGAKADNLSGAINRVTQQSTNVAYDHVGLFEIHQDSLFVLHATGQAGSIRETFASFFQSKQKEAVQLAVYRLGEDFTEAIPLAIRKAKTMLGKPYNWSYVLNDSSFYCSDFVERAFRDYQIFALEPMTFINPQTGQTDAFWVDFYKKQGLEVPEGKPGCNPNGLASSPKLVFAGYIDSKDALQYTYRPLRDTAITRFHENNYGEAEKLLEEYYTVDKTDSITQNILLAIFLKKLKDEKKPEINFNNINIWQNKYTFVRSHEDIRKVKVIEAIKLAKAAFEQENFVLVDLYYQSILSELEKTTDKKSLTSLANLNTLFYNYGLHKYYNKDFKDAKKILIEGVKYYPNDASMKTMLDQSNGK